MTSSIKHHTTPQAQTKPFFMSQMHDLCQHTLKSTLMTCLAGWLDTAKGWLLNGLNFEPTRPDGSACYKIHTAGLDKISIEIIQTKYVNKLIHSQLSITQHCLPVMTRKLGSVLACVMRKLQFHYLLQFLKHCVTRGQAVARIADRTASQQTLVISDCC